jgi:hypothetical protein
VVQHNGERLFCIKTNAYYLFFGGVDRKDIPSLMAAKNREELILYQFDEKGELVGKEARLRPANRVTVEVSYEVHRFPVEVPEEFVRWQEEIGFKDQTIPVREFFDEESRIGIKELPDHYREILAGPRRYIEWLWGGEDYTDDELVTEIKEWHEEIKRWRDEEKFVFRCG